MRPESTQQVLAFAHELADVAGAAILPYFRAGAAIENKAEQGFDPVTAADKAAEQAMRAKIRAERPEDAIVGEEFDDHVGTSGWTWVLDPIDGTRAFIAGTTTWGVLIGARYEDRARIGIMDQPFSGERWAASPERGFWSRGRARQPLVTRKKTALDQAILATTDPFLFEPHHKQAFLSLRAATRLARYGLDCTAYALLAHGHIDLVVEPGLKDVDIAALIPIVEAAGGVVTDWHGRHHPKGGDIIAAGCPELHAKALALLTNP
ncbi:histidinol-phosphatase [Candidatus Phycosocius bacilliformis]|uniref:Histidinol-phosphatase n=1 Tax=Candidatus Phycosocius bacilliformis TaxID=1445552 RepID=A0A2P2EC91_9PROT|nr:histidinol-phosphatase [Candidatus Phycosocius bacilliformis]GBF58651.1 histidinol-phosphatase [Candidatus Phycosocius bacilliformis]